MKVTKISEHIWSLKTWIIIPIHVWLVADKDGLTLVDAGIPSMASGILRTIDELGRGPLNRIVLTHGHSDHVGAIPRIIADRKVPVYVNSIEIPYMEGELAYPRRKKAAASVPKGIVQSLGQGEDNAGLQAIGGLKPYWTPGHSPGHTAFYHEQDRVLLAGDLFTSKKGRLNRPMPMFTADMEEAVRSAAIVRELQPARVEVCHGNSVLLPGKQVEDYMRKFLPGLSL